MADTSSNAPTSSSDNRSSTSPPQCGPGPPSEMDLGDYITKGTKLSTYLDMDAATLTRNFQAEGKIALNEGIASPFTQPQQLSSRGWEYFSELVEVGGRRLRERKAILQSLGVSGSIVYNTAVSSIHNKPYTTTSGCVILPSYGEYTAIHNPREGVIISYLETGPGFKIGEKENVQALPHLHHWSYITFLNYTREAVIQGVPVSRLKHILRTDIETPEVRRVIQMVVGADCPAYLTWPERRTFSAENEGARALLGTENGWGVLWMILRHPELGRKRIKNVSVYGQIRDVEDRHDFEAEGNRVHLYFELVDT